MLIGRKGSGEAVKVGVGVGARSPPEYRNTGLLEGLA